MRRACRIHPIAALQSEYSLWTRVPERAVLAACRELGIGFVPFSPLGRGFLTGAVKDLDRLEQNDVRRGLPRFQGENLQQNVALVQRLEEMARAKGCTAPQLALAWLLAKGEDIVPIPGHQTRRRISKTMPRPSTSRSARRKSPRSTRRFPSAARPANGIRRPAWRCSRRNRRADACSGRRRRAQGGQRPEGRARRRGVRRRRRRHAAKPRCSGSRPIRSTSSCWICCCPAATASMC